MQIFISWSGETSRVVATALKRWVPDVIQHAEIWMSEHDIDAGLRWCEALTKTLEESQFGIMCLTKENQQMPWLLFEAGCLANSARVSRIVPYLYGLTASEVKYPLAQFQSVDASRQGTLQLLQIINLVGQQKIDNDRLTRIFERYWPDLQNLLEAVPRSPYEQPAMRSERDMLEEILSLMRVTTKQPLATRSPYTETDFVEVNAAPFMREDHRFRLTYEPDQSVSDFLDAVYFELRENGGSIPAYSYGKVWFLEDVASGQKFHDLGSEYCASRGKSRDERPIQSVGIRRGQVLRVLSGRFGK